MRPAARLCDGGAGWSAGAGVGLLGAGCGRKPTLPPAYLPLLEQIQTRRRGVTWLPPGCLCLAAVQTCCRWGPPSRSPLWTHMQTMATSRCECCELPSSRRQRPWRHACWSVQGGGREGGGAHAGSGQAAVSRLPHVLPRQVASLATCLPACPMLRRNNMIACLIAAGGCRAATVLH